MCWFSVHTASYPRRRNFPANGASTSSASNQNQQRRPSTKHEKKRSDAAPAETTKPNQGGDPWRTGAIKVTLLRRGESLSSLTTKIGDSNHVDQAAEDPAAIRARSDSELAVPRKVRKAATPDAYAGAAFDSSPSPRCLPQPTFFNKRGDATEAFEDGATRFSAAYACLE